MLRIEEAENSNTMQVKSKCNVISKLATGTGLKVLIVHARWNSTVVDSLVNRTIERLVELGVRNTDISLKSVPGSFELPYAVSQLASQYDAVIAIGVLIRGDTMHFELIAEAVCRQLLQQQMQIERPIIFGVLACNTEDQALERAGLIQGHRNLGEDWAEAAVEMASLDVLKRT